MEKRVFHWKNVKQKEMSRKQTLKIHLWDRATEMYGLCPIELPRT